LKRAILAGVRSAGYDVIKPKTPAAAQAVFAALLKSGAGIVDLDLYRKIYGAAAETRCFYNIGAGRWHHLCWQNVDYHSDYYNYGSTLRQVRSQLSF
jgi:hypothetical protein